MFSHFSTKVASGLIGSASTHTLERYAISSSVIDPALKGEASASLCESICGIQRRTGRLNTDAYDPVRQDDRADNC